MPLRHFIPAVALLLTLSGCKKHDEEIPAGPVVTNYASYLENKTSEKIYVDLFVYKGENNYDEFVKQITIEPTTRIPIPPEGLTEGSIYSYDWHNADYTLTGWMPYPVAIPLTVVGGDDYPYYMTHFTYYANYKGKTVVLNANWGKTKDRIIALSGDGKETVWAAVDAYKNGTSIWDTLNAAGKIHKLLITKTDSLIDSNATGVNPGSIRKEKFMLIPSMPSDQFRLEAGYELTIIMSNNLTISGISYKTTSTDTLYYVWQGRSTQSTPNGYIEPILKMAKIATRR